MLVETLLARCQELLQQYLSRISESAAGLTDEQMWWRPNERSNSAANVILHLCGNLSQWGLAGLGGETYERHRQAEFETRGAATRQDLLDTLSQIVARACVVLARLDAAELERVRAIQGYEVTGLRALLGIVEHMSYHTGQIVFIAKMLAPGDYVIDFYPQHRNE
jgi:uncharacterized damage-inducible protein DinB